MPSSPPRRLKVNSRRNSVCSARLSDLDWGNWFTDGDAFTPGLYLHVHHKDGDRIFRVYCRHNSQRRLAMVGGELHWLVDATDA